MNPARPIASLGLDLDNLWSYLKIHGDAGWESHPTYLPTFVPLLTRVVRARNLRMTLFVVGQDAALEKNGEALRALAAEGHEIGNHSFLHEPWLHLYSRAAIEAEIRRAGEAIEAATGRAPTGFRGPGFSLSPDTLRALVALRYRYDCSTLPTFLGPLARAYYFRSTSGLSAGEREKRSRLYGTLGDGLRPLRPYAWKSEGRTLVEIPVTTMPGLRTPFHLSYLLFLRRFSRAASLAYLRTALALCRLARITPSFLLHPLDFLGGDLVRELAFFPGMDLPTGAKIDFVHAVLDEIQPSFQIVTLESHARAVEASPAAEVRRLKEEPALG